jgi:hypothetical protein
LGLYQLPAAIFPIAPLVRQHNKARLFRKLEGTFHLLKQLITPIQRTMRDAAATIATGNLRWTELKQPQAQSASATALSSSDSTHS